MSLFHVKYRVKSYYDPPNMAILNILSTSEKNCSSNGFKDMAILKVAFPIKRGVAIFSMFAADRHFGTCQVVPWGQITLKQW